MGYVLLKQDTSFKGDISNYIPVFENKTLQTNFFLKWSLYETLLITYLFFINQPRLKMSHQQFCQMFFQG